VCIKQDQKRNKAFSYLFRTYLLITISVMVSGRLGAMSRMEVFSSSMNCMSMDSITEVFYRLNIMLLATKNTLQMIIWSFSKIAHWHILYATQSKPLNFTFPNLSPQQPRCDWWTPLIIRFRESYNSMNMSRDSTSLKKSSGDCLKLAKQR